MNRAIDEQAGGSHYLEMEVQPWEVIDTWPLEQRIGFYRGCQLQYNMRLGCKEPSLKTAQKMAHVAAKLVEVLAEPVTDAGRGADACITLVDDRSVTHNDEHHIHVLPDLLTIEDVEGQRMITCDGAAPAW